VPDEVVGVQDVPLPADPEAQELRVDGLEGDPDPRLRGTNPIRIMVSSIRIQDTERLATRNRSAIEAKRWTHCLIASWLLLSIGSIILDAFLNDSAEK